MDQKPPQTQVTVSMDGLVQGFPSAPLEGQYVQHVPNNPYGIFKNLILPT